MGLNHAFYIVLAESELEAALHYLEGHGMIYGGRADLLEGHSRCLTMRVPVDRFIKRYIRDFYHGYPTWDYKATRLEDVVQDGYYGVGCVDTRLRIVEDEVYMEFVCVASGMSLLFDESPNIRAWFIDLCRSVKAKLGFYIRDGYSDELFWFYDRIIGLRLDPDTDPQDSWPLYQEFYGAVFDNLYNVENPEP